MLRKRALVRSASHANVVPNTSAQAELPRENSSEFHSKFLKSEKDSKILVKLANVGAREVAPKDGDTLEIRIKMSGGRTK